MLFATDLSTNSLYAFQYAVNYAIKNKAKLIVFHVINQRSITFAKILATFFNEAPKHKFIQKKSNAALKRMQNLLEIIRKKELNDHPEHLNKVEYLVVHYGRIAEEIVEKTNRWGCELIILGPRRKRFLGRIFLPSISRKVIRRTDTPVHVIKWSKGEKR
jgi:nucleotide-binding universal stress UspA family protein